MAVVVSHTCSRTSSCTRAAFIRLSIKPAAGRVALTTDGAIADSPGAGRVAALFRPRARLQRERPRDADLRLAADQVRGARVRALRPADARSYRRAAAGVP